MSPHYSIPSQFLTFLLLIFFAPSLVVVGELKGQGLDPLQAPITFTELEETCAHEPSSSDVVFDFCKQLDSLADASEIPTIAEINSARQVTETRDVQQDVRVAPVNTSSLITGGINQTSLFFGLTDFLLSRAELEAQAWVLDDFTRTVCQDEDNGERVTLSSAAMLKRTCAVFRANGKTVSLLAGGGAMLRTTLKEDLRRLLRTLSEEIYLISTISREQDQRDIAAAVYLLASGVERLLDGETPIEAFRNVPDLREWNEPEPLRTFDNLPLTRWVYHSSQVLHAFPVSEEGLVTPVGQEAWTYLMKTVLVNLKDDVDANGGNHTAAMLNSLLDIRTNVERFRSNIEPTIPSLVKSGKRFRNAVRRDTTVVAKLQFAADATDKAIDVWRAFLISLAESQVEDDVHPPLSAKHTRILDAAQQISRDVAAARYTSLAANILVLVPEMYADGLPPALTRVLFLGGDLASIQDAASAKRAIEAFAAPVGGYRRKKEGVSSFFTLNAYVGGFFGGEHTFPDGAAIKQEDAVIAGVFVPIGVEVGWPVGEGNFSIFAQGLDVGALASYRLSGNENVEALPEVGVQQVFSPGLYIVYGFPNKPVSVLFGASFIPKHRKLESEELSLNSLRLGIALSIDIPLFP